MNNKDINDKILSILSNTYPKGLTYSEICGQTGSTKKTKSSVSQSLAAMLLDGKLLKERKRYRLSKPPQTQETESPAKGQTPQKEQQQQSSTLIEGTFDATSLARDRSFAFVRTPEHDYFVDSEDTLNAYHNDKVLIEPRKRSRQGESGAVRRILERANETLPGSVSKVQNRWIFVASNPKIHSWFEISDLGNAQPGQKVILTVTNWGNPLSNKMPVGKITEILGESGDPQVELLAVIREYQLPLEFPEDVIEEVSRLPEHPQKADISKRQDLRSLFTFTIDPASAKDFDDAISIKKLEKGYRLWVHIADVSHYLPIGSAAFTEAAKRGNSFYFPKKVIPMIPERLSNLICSLRPGEDKLCMTVETEFDSSGKVLKQRLYESVISSDARLAYEDVDDLYAGKETKLSPTLKTALQEGRKLSAKLTKMAKDAGYIFFDLPDIEYEYDEEGFVHRLGLSEETESHKLIENFMLVANKYVATELSKRAPATIYRIHEDPDSQKIERMAAVLDFYGISYIEQENLNKSIQHLLYSLPNKDYHRVFDRIILRSMKKAKYTTEHIRHFGLSLEDYTHFTSPIRRLCDLVVHHLCKRYICKTSQENISQEQIKHWASVASEQELQADQSERDIERIYSATFMKDRIGEEFTALLVSTNSSSAFLRLNEMPVTAVLKKDQFGKGKWEYHDREMRFVNPANNRSFELLDSLKVRIMEVSDDVYLELTDAPDAHTHYHNIKRPLAAKAKSNKDRKRVDVRPARKKGDNKTRNQSRKKK
ncbi:MAG: VacB/RNase II family 3'-5' exoribonuclease [Candidatus Cloacimonetes bacterium]|jgi:ribonuclease R|nr:VacB/RNase II family 3'-5' exoribonuclease [Candidatus Cloacimonadota bacterium]MDD4277366.1 VacB/RNase II family 3'-5' exoribonuclease [Candidatus Cloacimonadota bacterium]MDY0325185.1 VacB/RNase II family 3'-5' exoribonuclease [Candidatus Cloacimonadaceae bacterium]